MDAPMRGLRMLRVMFGLTALTSSWFLFAPSARLEGPERLGQVLAAGGVLVWSIGLLVPWGRWIRVVSPGPNLGLFTRMVGWAGACGLPLAIVTAHPGMAFLCALSPVAALGMWKQRAWAVWVWTAVIACVIAFRLADLVGVGSGDGQTAGAFSVGKLVTVLLNCLCALVFLGAVWSWGRSLRSSGAAPGAPSAG